MRLKQLDVDDVICLVKLNLYLDIFNTCSAKAEQERKRVPAALVPVMWRSGRPTGPNLHG